MLKKRRRKETRSLPKKATGPRLIATNSNHAKISASLIPRQSGVKWQKALQKNGWKPRKRGDAQTSRHVTFEKTIGERTYFVTVRRTREEIFPPVMRDVFFRSEIPEYEIKKLIA